jgi:gluconate 2-dehydrogenase gamma chain
MAGQGIQRREMLRVIGVAAVASHFPGFVKWAYAQAHEHASDEPAAGRPKAYTPQFFSREDFACVERLTDLIIPTDGTPGAREVGVAEFVDFMVAHDTEQQQPMRAGLAWLQEQSGRRFAQPFLELSEAQQVSLLEPLAYESKYREGEEVGREFFRRVKELTAMGFYTSEIGWRELDNPALRFYAESPACPHKNDPEHRHLPAPKR